MIDVSFLIPTIRTNRWQTVLDTLKQSCKKYSWEVVFAGPFDPPNVDMTNVQYFKTYQCPSAAAQMGASKCQGRLLYHVVDDAKFIPDAVDVAIGLYNEKCGHRDVVNMPYTEADNYCPDLVYKSEYWNAHHHATLVLPGIPNHYRIALHFLMNTNYFKEIGGFDCRYEYLNFNLHDLMFRIQYDGGKIYDAPNVTNCDHYRGKDHAVIEDAYTSDYELFKSKYNNPNALDSADKTDFNNWMQQPAVWTRRFTKMFSNYEELEAETKDVKTKIA